MQNNCMACKSIFLSGLYFYRMELPENLLHFAWKFRLFDQQNLQLASGEPLQILHPGMHNRDAGPDFFHARLRIGQTNWAGNVEMHRFASEWTRHGHDSDPAYKNVLIHAVAVHDADVRDHTGRILPTLVLGDRLPADLIRRWQMLGQEKTQVPCSRLGRPDAMLARAWLDRMLTERLEKRSGKLLDLLSLYRGNWQEVFYIWLARAFGCKVNALPFEMLARSVPLGIVLQHLQSRFQLEALFFGQSALLPERPADEYAASLLAEYQFLRHKYALRPLEKHIWKFLRMRPANFPTVRIAQFAACLSYFPNFMEALKSGAEWPDLTKVEVSPYWFSHYHFEKHTHKKKAGLGKDAVNLLFTNVIAPFLVVFGRKDGNSAMVDQALDIFRKTRYEQNSITSQYRGIFPDDLHGGDSQALLHLRESYCDKLRCTDCSVGQQLLVKKNSDQSFEK